MKTLQQLVKVTNPKGNMYTILDTNGSISIDRMYKLTLSRRIYQKDEKNVNLSLKQLLIAHDGNVFFFFRSQDTVGKVFTIFTR